jgi:hypothetical protein
VIRRFVSTLVLVAIAAGVACIDMSAPKGPASISALQLPSPSVVVGDTMRDSNGVAAPLRVIAFDANGNRLGEVAADFFITDTGRVAHIGGTTLVGDQLGTVHVIGQIGALQTPAVTIPVTVAPTNISPSTTPIDTLTVPITGDSATSMASSVLAVTLHGANDSTAQGFIVKYAIVYAPLTKAGATSPAVYLADDLGHIASSDTSDASGASRKLTINSTFLADNALTAGTGTKIDSAVVNASVFYRGVLVPNSPVRFVVPFKVLLSVTK